MAQDSCIFPDEQSRTNIDRLNSDAFFEMSCLWVVRDFVRQNLGLAEGVHECGATRARSTLGIVSQGNTVKKGKDIYRQP